MHVLMTNIVVLTSAGFLPMKLKHSGRNSIEHRSATAACRHSLQTSGCFAGSLHGSGFIVDGQFLWCRMLQAATQWETQEAALN